MSAGKLVHKDTNTVVNIGDSVQSERDGEITVYKVMGWRKPHKVSSSGRIFVQSKNSDFEQSFFPHVFDLKIVGYD
jgi:hypothetical protein